MKDHHTIANDEVLNAFSGGHNLTRGLMSENSRSRMRTSSDFLKVSAADASGEDSDFDVVDAHLGLGNVLEPQAAFFAAFY